MQPYPRIVFVAVVFATALATAAGVWFLTAVHADAHPLRSRLPARHLSAREVVGLELQVLRHDRQTLRFFERHAFLLYSAPQPTKRTAWRVVLFHRAQAKWAAGELRQARAYLVPAVAHRALWLCIHRGEAGWHQADNATGVTYFGGLQMTVSWLGLIEGRASDLSPHEQMRAAETGYRQSGYSTAWLIGQWPQTAPPCLGLT